MNANIVEKFVTDAKTAELVAVYNLGVESPIKKFADRKTAETRTVALLRGYKAEAGKDGYGNFFSDFATDAVKAGIELPAPIEEVEEVVKVRKNARAEGTPKQPHSAHVNLRCLTCNYVAKTTLEFLALGRLKCPVHPKELLLTKAERKALTGDDSGE